MKNFADEIAYNMRKIASSDEMKQLFRTAQDQVSPETFTGAMSGGDMPPAETMAAKDDLEVEEECDEKSLEDMSDSEKCAEVLKCLARASEALDLLDEEELSQAALDLAKEVKSACKD